MMKKMSAVAGLLKRLCLLIALLGISNALFAQDTNAQFLWAISDADGFIAHVTLPRGISLESAELETSSGTITLAVQPTPLAVEEWLIVDASAAVLNTAPAIQASLQNFLANATAERRIGLIRFAATIEIFEASSRPSDLQAWMSDYQAHNNESGCLAEALHRLNEVPQERERARHVLLIVGAYQACGELPQLKMPVDILVVGAEIDPIYAELANSRGGTVYRASLQSLNARMTEINTAWLDPVFALRGEYVADASATIHLSLSNGQRESLPAHYEVAQIATATPIPSPTDAPTVAILASETPEISPSETAAPEIIASPSPEITEITVISTLPAASPEASPTPSLPAPLPVSNQGLIIGGGIAAIVVVLGVMGLLLVGGRRRQVSNGDKLDMTAIFQYDDEAELDQTDIVSMREILAQSGPTLAAKLVDDASGIVYEIHRPFTTLGRKENNDIRIENDKQISREHLRFSVRDDGSVWMTRLTQNPILLNDIPVENSLQLHAGDIIQVSPSLRLKMETLIND